MLSTVIVLTLIVMGVIFCAVAAIGVVIMPDIFLRMSASTKASTLGAGLVLLGVALNFMDGNVDISGRAIAIALFLILTAPVGAHMIGRAAYFEPTHEGEPPILSELTVLDEMHNRPDPYYLPGDPVDDSLLQTKPQRPDAE